MLHHRAGSGSSTKVIFAAADRLADALHKEAVDEANWDEVRDSGALELLTSLLRLGPCRAATQAAAALTHLAHNTNNRDAIREHEAILPLVVLLSEPQEGSAAFRAQDLLQQAGQPAVDWIETATNAAAALRNLTHNNQANQDGIRDAGGIGPLIELLRMGPSSNAASRAADALGGLARNLSLIHI